MAKYHPSFSFPRRWQRSRRCFEGYSQHRCDRRHRRALLDYFKRRCFHHHVGQPDTPSSMFGFVLVPHLMFFQQTAGIHIQMFGEPIYRHIRLNRLGQLGGTAFPFPVVSRYDFCYGFQYRVWRLFPKLIFCMVSSDTTADPAGLCLPPPRWPCYLFASPSASGAHHLHTPASPWSPRSSQSCLPQAAFWCGGRSERRRHPDQQIALACRLPHSRWSSCNYHSPPHGLFVGYRSQCNSPFSSSLGTKMWKTSVKRSKY